MDGEKTMKSISLRRACVGTILCAVATLLVPLATQAKPDQTAQPLLTISGKTGAPDGDRRAIFDLARLEALPQKTFTTQTPWYEKPVQFSGPLLRDVLAAVQARGSQLKAIALNDYKITIPVADSQKFDMVIALRMNGEPMSMRNKGPLFVVYPFDSAPELHSNTYYSRSIWQLKAIEVE